MLLTIRTLWTLEIVSAARQPSLEAVGAIEVMNGKRQSSYGWMLRGDYCRPTRGWSRIQPHHSARCADIRPLDRHRARHPQLRVDQVGSSAVLRVLAGADGRNLVFLARLDHLPLRNVLPNRNRYDDHRWGGFAARHNWGGIREKRRASRQDHRHSLGRADIASGGVSFEHASSNRASLTPPESADAFPGYAVSEVLSHARP
jgi:hypothetical protein